MSIKIYADPITVNCRKVIAGFDLIGAPYELVHRRLLQGRPQSRTLPVTQPERFGAGND